MVDRARQDLATRVSVAVGDITLVEAAAVVWSNASLGCPRDGMAYADVLNPRLPSAKGRTLGSTASSPNIMVAPNASAPPLT